MITEKQYLKARKTVFLYEKQQREAKVIKREFVLSDLCVFNWSIEVPCLTESVVDEDFASNISDKLDDMGFTVDYVSLDDMGYISIKFLKDMLLDNTHTDAVLSVLNELSPPIKK